MAGADGRADVTTSATAGQTFVVSAAHLRPGLRVALFLAPEGKQGCCGIAVGGVHRVPRHGRVRFQFTWPSAYHRCTLDEGRECIDARWRGGQRVVVGLGAPGQRRARLKRGDWRQRLAVVKMKRPKKGQIQLSDTRPSLSLPGLRLLSAPLDHACSSPWMSSAGSVGSGFGYEVSFSPTTRARYLARVVPGAYDDIWADLHRCVPFSGLSPSQEGSMYQQMVCHVLYGVARFGGRTFDFEAWRPEVSVSAALDPRNECNVDLGPHGADGYLNHIVQWSGDPSAQKAAWLVVNSGGSLVRNWIPSIKIYNCLKKAGKAGPDSLAASFLDRYLPDAAGVWVSESSACGTPPPASSPSRPPSSPGPGSPPTWNEQQGSLGANTFLNPYNASGMGVKIQPYQWVAVSCKVYAPQIVSANPDGYWYRIASPPWSNAYYAVANTFWNGDIPGHKPYVHNTDFAVPNC